MKHALKTLAVLASVAVSSLGGQAQAQTVYWSVGVTPAGVQLGVSNYIYPAPAVVMTPVVYMPPVVVAPRPLYAPPQISYRPYGGYYGHHEGYGRGWHERGPADSRRGAGRVGPPSR